MIRRLRRLLLRALGAFAALAVCLVPLLIALGWFAHSLLDTLSKETRVSARSVFQVQSAVIEQSYAGLASSVRETGSIVTSLLKARKGESVLTVEAERNVASGLTPQAALHIQELFDLLLNTKDYYSGLFLLSEEGDVLAQMHEGGGNLEQFSPETITQDIRATWAKNALLSPSGTITLLRAARSEVDSPRTAELVALATVSVGEQRLIVVFLISGRELLHDIEGASSPFWIATADKGTILQYFAGSEPIPDELNSLESIFSAFPQIQAKTTKRKLRTFLLTNELGEFHWLVLPRSRRLFQSPLLLVQRVPQAPLVAFKSYVIKNFFYVVCALGWSVFLIFVLISKATKQEREQRIARSSRSNTKAVDSNHNQEVERLRSQCETMRKEFDAILSAIPEPLLILDTQMRVVACNSVCCRLLGQRKEEIEGVSVERLVDPLDQEQFNAFLRQPSSGNDWRVSQTTEYKLTRSDGRSMSARFYLTQSAIGNQVFRVLRISRTDKPKPLPTQLPPEKLRIDTTTRRSFAKKPASKRSLPASSSQPPRTYPPTMQEPPTRPSSSAPRPTQLEQISQNVLVISAERTLQRFLIDCLRAARHFAVVANSVEEAQVIFEPEEYDFVVLDATSLSLDPASAIAQIRLLEDSVSSNLRFILIGKSELAEAAEQDVSVYHLASPVDPQEFLRLLELAPNQAQADWASHPAET